MQNSIEVKLNKLINLYFSGKRKQAAKIVRGLSKLQVCMLFNHWPQLEYGIKHLANCSEKLGFFDFIEGVLDGFDYQDSTPENKVGQQI